jgi:hypothetical protein
VRSHNLMLATITALLLLSSIAAAQTLSGTVSNATTNKPAYGDEIVLLSLGQGMEETGRTKADAQGHFSFNLDNSQGPHLVRAIHQGVTYHRMAPPGSTSVDLEVYDVGKRVAGVEVVADVMRVHTEAGQLEVTREFAVQNSSTPPRTQMSDRNLEFYLPDGIKIVESSAMTEHGNPVKSAPVPESEKNRYSFIFPLRPGITRFQVSYQLPYNGSATLDPHSLYPLQHFVAIVPKSMDFSAAPGASYKPMNDPNQPDANVQLASATTGGETLAFKISGEGTLGARVEGAGAPNESKQGQSHPGGGLGPPIDAPDPLQKYRWYILGSMAAALAVAGAYIASRQQAAARVSLRRQIPALKFDESTRDSDLVPMQAVPRNVARIPASNPAIHQGRPSMLLEGLKEEMFQLEVERKRGDVSQQEYEAVKAALDQTLQRALKNSQPHALKRNLGSGEEE